MKLWRRLLSMKVWVPVILLGLVVSFFSAPVMYYKAEIPTMEEKSKMEESDSDMDKSEKVPAPPAPSMEVSAPSTNWS